MSAAPVTGGPSLPQERKLVTSIPGPKSQELLARKNDAVALLGSYDWVVCIAGLRKCGCPCVYWKIRL